MVIWKLEDGSDKLIGFDNKALYKSNPKDLEINKIYNDFKFSIISKDFFSIPFNYITEINLEQGKKYIEVKFGNNSSEHFKILNQNKKEEFFNLLKDQFHLGKYIETKTNPSKKSIIAIIILFILYLITIFFANELSNGAEYDVKHPNSIFAILLALATFGIKKVTILFSFLIGIPLLNIIIRKPKKIKKITLK